jgi:hypothetical protein
MTALRAFLSLSRSRVTKKKRKKKTLEILQKEICCPLQMLQNLKCFVESRQRKLKSNLSRRKELTSVQNLLLAQIGFEN